MQRRADIEDGAVDTLAALEAKAVEYPHSVMSVFRYAFDMLLKSRCDGITTLLL
eukprot:COSAG02_NODE_26081_length_641_cov_1.385609_1_plen_53_part_01